MTSLLNRFKLKRFNVSLPKAAALATSSLLLVGALTVGLSGCNAVQNVMETGTFSGIQKVAPEAVQAALKTTQPSVLFFKSEYCKLCKTMTPWVEAQAAAYPEVTTRLIYLASQDEMDIALLDLFQPVTVPTVVGLTAEGQVQSSSSGLVNEEALGSLYASLSQGITHPKALSLTEQAPTQPKTEPVAEIEPAEAKPNV